jgi:penicillin-binding protein 1A
MARNQRNGRVEPSFDQPGKRQRSTGLAVGEEDRVVPSNRKKRSSRKPRASRPRRSRAGLFGRLIYWCFVLALWAGVGAVWRKDAERDHLGDPGPLAQHQDRLVDGQLLANRGMTGGEAVGLHEMSPYIPQAVIAIEDRRFYSHFGIDPLGLRRAMFSNIIDHRPFLQGGSTLTQQLAKNLFLKPDRTLERKVQEVLLALWLEQKHTKDQILEMYLNRVYFGSGAYGVEAASRRYFGKSARDVTLAEAATAGRPAQGAVAAFAGARSQGRRSAPSSCSPPCATRG